MNKFDGIFGIDGPIMRFLNKMADVLIVSLLWLLCCLPVLTIGASTTALYYASMKSIWGEGSITKNFFKSFRENIKQSIVVELIFLVLLYVLYIDVQVIFQMEGSAAMFMRIFSMALVFIFVSLVSYIFPLLSRFVYSTGTLFKNAFLISLMNLPYTILIVLINISPVLLFLIRPDFFLRILPLILFMGAGFFAYINSLFFIRIFRKYTPKEVLEAEDKARKAAKEDF